MNTTETTRTVCAWCPAERLEGRHVPISHGMCSACELDVMVDAELWQQREELRRQAEAAHEDHPQYDGHWDGWVLVRVTSQVVTKMGTAFAANELALMKPTTDLEEAEHRRWAHHWRRELHGDTRHFVTCYSTRNVVDTSVPVDVVEVIR